MVQSLRAFPSCFLPAQHCRIKRPTSELSRQVATLLYCITITSLCCVLVSSGLIRWLKGGLGDARHRTAPPTLPPRKPAMTAEVLTLTLSLPTSGALRVTKEGVMVGQGRGKRGE